MKDVHRLYRQWVGYSLGGTLVLVLFGYWLILYTYPNLFYRLGTLDLPFGMGMIIDGTMVLASGAIEASRTGFVDALRMPLMIILPSMIWLLMAAAVIRAIRARSWRPLWVISLNLGLGIAAFPILSWIVVAVFWVISLALRAQSWAAGFLSNLGEATWVRTTGGAILAVVVGSALIALLVKVPKSRWIIGGLVVAGGLLYMFREPLALALEPVWGGLGWAVGGVAAFVGTVFGWLFGVFFAVVAWVFAVAVLAFLGSTMWTPLRDAARSGHRIDRFADVAAGVGVAVSTIITASAYNTNFAQFLLEATEKRADLPVIGLIPNVADLSFAGIMPSAFDDFFSMLFMGFNGTPDLLIVAVACAIGVVVLAFTSGSYEPSVGQPTIITLGFLRVIVAMAAVMVALWFTTLGSD
ncbi:MAG: hypothetical protein IPL36_09715 [Nigerium sp.]|nr:hypothetical protein [Nigerium sp.]